MNELEHLGLGLRALAVFGGLRRDPVVERFATMLEAKGTAAQVSACSAFAGALLEHGGSWTDYLLARVLEDENVYVTRRARGGADDAALEACAASELKTLETLAQVGTEAVRAYIRYDGYLPGWETHEADFAAAYAQHLRDIGQRGYGIFARYSMFTVRDGQICPVRFADPICLHDLKGYERERQVVIDNTLALLKGKTAANTLLYGDAGTGKSSTVKALVNEYKDEGLRLIEIGKHQFVEIPHIVETLSDNPLKFILFIDDLSFTQENDEFNALKAMLQGSVFERTGNIAVYATSNRRHIVKETFSDREDDDVHRGETMEELVSLSQRFGLTVGFFKPGKQAYLDIVHALKQDYDLSIDDEELDLLAERKAAGGRTPRAARQLIEHLKRMEQ